MGEILKLFGIHWIPLLAQVLLFLIVYLVLRKYAFGPVTAILEQRKARIAEAEANLEKTRASLAGAEDEAKRIVREANDKADEMVTLAKESAATAGKKETDAARAEAESILEKAKTAAERERDEMMSGLKQEFGRLVAGATSAVTGKVLTDQDHETINQDASSHLN